ncbi:phenylacetate-CoA oxygenase, PaaJ subunit [Haladaptatus litoreus]|uniref:Phenylacetate-CoA oxygenase, PaaJ subunit n=1 Tax=Haladaptatus litoreus TaxID=553468 RepID=A0A1N6XWY4_9EURY|nr:1,2-phenylacetyl-CoA epoxidase subunit PaaD [Haladaptatus litoreus]SIR06743.1 phenylacetate-CoA oxygenase, PaaJ subunit [Haladaptatus litoreus]
MSNEPQAHETDSAEYDIESEPTACAYTDYSESGQSPEELPATGEGATGLEKRVWDALYDIEDPEMPISIVDLGLIYGVQMEGDSATVIMTLTYTGCPARKMLTEEIEEAVADVDGVEDADLELVWNPPWSIEMVTEQGKDDLRDFGLSI